MRSERCAIVWFRVSSTLQVVGDLELEQLVGGGLEVKLPADGGLEVEWSVGGTFAVVES